jgi:hypothetical protein
LTNNELSPEEEKRLFQILDRLEENREWLRCNEERLRLIPKYRNKYVAVANKKIIAYDKDLDNLIIKLRKKYGEAIAREAAISYITPRRVRFLFLTLFFIPAISAIIKQN